MRGAFVQHPLSCDVVLDDKTTGCTIMMIMMMMMITNLLPLSLHLYLAAAASYQFSDYLLFPLAIASSRPILPLKVVTARVLRGGLGGAGHDEMKFRIQFYRSPCLSLFPASTRSRTFC